jgi:hypothetical protein
MLSRTRAHTTHTGICMSVGVSRNLSFLSTEIRHLNLAVLLTVYNILEIICFWEKLYECSLRPSTSVTLFFMCVERGLSRKGERTV